MKLTEIIARALRPNDGPCAQARLRAMDADGEVEILIYDQIGYWGITAEDFRREIGALEADVIHVRIDSPGGDVFMARAMKTALEQHPARIVAHVDGIAASAASYVMLGADEIEAANGAFIMIHNGMTLTIGDHREHGKSASLLEKVDATIRADYAAKTGKSVDDFRELMDETTWLEASEALELGLIDRVFEKDGGANNRFDLSVFDNAPAALASANEVEAADAHRARQMRKLEFFERIAP